jgi:hypothetical protein
MTMQWTNQSPFGAGGPVLPKSAEICVNLWYCADEDGFIYSLRIHLYTCVGTEEDKLAFLRSRAYLDYLVAKPYPIPDEFHTHLQGTDGKITRLPVIHQDQAVALGGIDHLCFPWLDSIEKGLPAQTELKIPEDPLMGVWALTLDADGKVVPVDAIRGKSGPR